MDSDEEDFVFYGTPIAREDDVTTSRKKKSVAEASGQLRTLAPWKQEVVPPPPPLLFRLPYLVYLLNGSNGDYDCRVYELGGVLLSVIFD